MKSPIGLVLVLLIGLTGCGGAPTRNADSSGTYASDSAPTSQPVQPEVAAKQVAATTYSDPHVQTRTTALPEANYQQVSLTQADTAASAAEAADRKIIRNASLTMEVNSTSDTQHKVTSIAEAHGGFVVTSEAKQRETADPSQRTLDIKLVVRVPSERFGPVIDQIRGLAHTLREESLTGNDVTEEFIDLEARIRTQRALEVQFLEIMKQAKNVEDALEVQRQIADVRTDIEKLEGRKRFLENRSSLSTITVNLEAPRQIVVNTTSFGRSLRESVSDGVDLGSAILLFLVRAGIILVPITIFLLLPMGLLFRYFVRRAQRMRLAEPFITPNSATGD
ncbi:MAG TPA: DUF4349 domain-containing protein [Pyrinomonadaceae bacterium]|nr:DUF4349 domain-containing protein [Pyrinomonadaceae bacterium]